MARSEAQKRADKKYHAKTYKELRAQTKIVDFELIDNYCKLKNISKTRFITNACKYFIAADTLPPDDGLNDDNDKL